VDASQGAAAYGWTKRGRAGLFTIAVGIPVLIIVGAATGRSRSAVGVPTWVSWTLAIPAVLVGLPLAWACTSLGNQNATNLMLKIYRRDGLDAAEKLVPAWRGPEKVGAQMFTLALALEREGDHVGAEAAYRRAVDGGFPPAMLNLANRLEHRGENAEAEELLRRATEAGALKGQDY